MNVNDDGVVLKGGKGIWADKDTSNGPSSEIIIENCSFGKVGAMLTLGSESIYDRNVILRNSVANNSDCALRLKFRPDTPQHYEYITVENITGTCAEWIKFCPGHVHVQDASRKNSRYLPLKNYVILLIYGKLNTIYNDFFTPN